MKQHSTPSPEPYTTTTPNRRLRAGWWTWVLITLAFAALLFIILEASDGDQEEGQLNTPGELGVMLDTSDDVVLATTHHTARLGSYSATMR